MKEALCLLLLWYIKAGERRRIEKACGYPDDWCGDKLVFDETRKFLIKHREELKKELPQLNLEELGFA